MAETKTAFSSKFHLHKRRHYVNELRSENINITTPSADNTNNFSNGIITFEIGAVNDIIDLRKAYFRVKWIYTKANNTNITPGAEVNDRNGFIIENNWFYKCFSQIDMRINGASAETVTAPGEVDTALKNIFYTYLHKQTGSNSGWITDKGDGRAVNFPIITPAVAGIDDPTSIVNVRNKINEMLPSLNTLSNSQEINIGYLDRKNKFPVIDTANATTRPYEQDFPIFPLFGFFTQERVFRGNAFTFQLTISGDYQNKILFGSSTSADIGVRIMNIELHTPIYEAAAPLQSFIFDQLKKDIEVFYLHRDYITRNIPATSNTYDLELGITRRRPHYIFVWFKLPSSRTGRRVNDDIYYLKSDTVTELPLQDSDPIIPAVTEFQLKSIRLKIDSQQFPKNLPLILDPVSNDVNDLIKYYQEFCRDHSYTVPQFTPMEFLENHAVAIFDLSAQVENTANLGLNISLTITKTGNQSVDVHILKLEEKASMLKEDRSFVNDIPLKSF